MRKLFCLLALLAWAAAPLGAKDIRLAVLEFENNTGRQDVEHLKKGLRDFFVTDLQELSGVTLVERGRIDEVLKEINMNQSKYFDPATAAKMGKQMGASHVLTGSYFCMKKKWRMDIRVVSTETGEVLVAGKQDGTEDDVFDMEKALVETMAKKLKPDLSRRELRKLNRPQTEKYASFEKYSRAVDKAESGDREGAVRLMEEVAREDKDFSLAADQLEKYRAQLLADIEQHARVSEEKALAEQAKARSDQEYVDQDFQNALKRRKLRDDSPDYYVSLIMSALHYDLRDNNHEYDREIEELVCEYEAEFLCKKHSGKVLQETQNKFSSRLISLREKIFDPQWRSPQTMRKKDPFKHLGTCFIKPHTWWDPTYMWWEVRRWRPRNFNAFNSQISTFYFIFNHDLQKSVRHSHIQDRVDFFIREYIVESSNKTQQAFFASSIATPYLGINNWSEIVIMTLNWLAQHEKDEDRRVAIKRALIYAIDAKKQKDSTGIVKNAVVGKPKYCDIYGRCW